MIESVQIDGREQKTNRLDSAWSAIRRHSARPRTIGNSLHRPEFFRAGRGALQIPARRPRNSPGRKPATERVANYSNLPPGHYHFHVDRLQRGRRAGTKPAACWTSPCSRNSGRRGGFAPRSSCVLVRNRRRHGALHFHPEIAAPVAVASNSTRRWKKSAPASPATCTTSSARTSRRWRCWAKWRRPTKIRPAEIESHAQQISQTARETTRSLDEIVWAVNPVQRHAGRPGQLRLQIRAGISRAGRTALPRRCAGPIAGQPKFRRKSATTSSSPSRKPSTTSSNTRRPPKPGFGCAWSRTIYPGDRRQRTRPGRLDASAAQIAKRSSQHAQTHGQTSTANFPISPAPNGGTVVRLTVPVKLECKA